jgi:hypothetical protein
MGETVVKPLKEFGKNSVRLVKRCTKPDRKGELPSSTWKVDDGSQLALDPRSWSDRALHSFRHATCCMLGMCDALSTCSALGH